MKGELYLDRRSPPVRSVLLLIEALGIEVDEKLIDLSKGEHVQEDFLKVNITLFSIHRRYFETIDIYYFC